MGARGPGARPLKNGKRKLIPPGKTKPLVVRKRPMPWQKKGLTKAQQVIAFLEYLPVTKGRLAGKKMRLIPSQREFIEHVFETDRKGRLKVSLAILSQAKGNGKTGLVAGLCLAALLGPLAEERGAVYSASIDRSKAGIVFEEMKAIIRRVPTFEARVNITDFHKKMLVLEGDGKDSTFESLSADASRAQGLAPTMWCYDELGEAPNGKLLEVLLESEGKRNHTLGIVLSTQAASDDHPLSKIIDDALENEDPRTHIQIHSVPMDADPFSDESLKIANPAWGFYLDPDALRTARDRARRLPMLAASYRRLRLNQRIDTRSEERLVTATVWKECFSPFDRDALLGRTAYGGLDLSGSADLTAFVLVFPNDDVPVGYRVIPFFWTPEGRMIQRTQAEQARFREWIDRGFMKAVPGNIVKTSVVARDLLEICSRYQVRSIQYDKWRIEWLKESLEEIGVELPLNGFGQGHSKIMAPSIEFLAETALTGRLQHDGNPVLTASVAGAIMRPDPAGNPVLDKPKSNKSGPVRIDGAVSLVMAIGGARTFKPEPKKPSALSMLQSPIWSVN